MQVLKKHLAGGGVVGARVLDDVCSEPHGPASGCKECYLRNAGRGLSLAHARVNQHAAQQVNRVKHMTIVQARCARATMTNVLSSHVHMEMLAK